MIELGNVQSAPAAAAVKETSDATFMADVIEASRQAPVIAYFTAAWCGPCKTLGPLLEKAVSETGGGVSIAKIDVDQNQMVASQMRVQSIPAVFAFVDGQPVDSFMGAVSPGEVTEFVSRISKGSGEGALDEALDAAEEMLEQGAVADAAQTFAAILGEDATNTRAIGGMIRATLAAGDADQAQTMLDGVSPELAEDPAITAAKAAIDLALQAADAGETADLRAKLATNADDHQVRFNLAIALSAAGDNEGAVEELLELFRRDREWNDGAARAQLFTIFDALGPKDPLALTARRRLSSMIFA